MTQHMGMMDFSDEEELDDELGLKTVGYLQLLPPHDENLSWLSKEFKDGTPANIENDWLREAVCRSACPGSRAGLALNVSSGINARSWAELDEFVGPDFGVVSEHEFENRALGEGFSWLLNTHLP